MNEWAPIDIENGVPATVEDLKTVLGRLDELSRNNMPVTLTEMTHVLEKIIEHYESEPIDHIFEDTFPISIGLIKQVEDRLELIDEKPPSPEFIGRNPLDEAGVPDIIALLQSLVEHY